MAEIKKVKASELPYTTDYTGFSALGIKRNPDGTVDNVTVPMEALKGNVDVNVKFSDLTEEQKANIKGEKGDPLRFEDLTHEQIEQLRGPQGDKLTFADLSMADKQSLKGPKGDKGDPLRYEDLSSAQREQLKGPKGDKFTFDELTPSQKRELKGEKGDPFKYSDFTPEQLQALKGEKGKDFRFEDFTEDQLAKLKGPKGDALDFSGLSEEQKKELGVKIDKAQIEQALGHKVDADVPANAKFTDTVYQHPSAHPASMITESAEKRFVSDAEKQQWSGKWDYNEETIKAVKVNNATNSDTVSGHTVGANVPKNAIFVTQQQVNKWNNPPAGLDEAAVRRIKVNNATSADTATTSSAVVETHKQKTIKIWIGTDAEYKSSNPNDNDTLAIVI